MDDVDAGFLDAADIEGVGVDELHDDDAENVFVGEGRGRKVPRLRMTSCFAGSQAQLGMTSLFSSVGDPHFGQAAEKFAESAGAAGGGVIRGEEFEEVVADGGFLFVQNCIGSAVDQDVGRDHGAEG